MKGKLSISNSIEVTQVGYTPKLSNPFKKF